MWFNPQPPDGLAIFLIDTDLARLLNGRARIPLFVPRDHAAAAERVIRAVYRRPKFREGDLQ